MLFSKINQATDPTNTEQLLTYCNELHTAAHIAYFYIYIISNINLLIDRKNIFSIHIMK